MSTTKQGVRDLNQLGPKRKRQEREGYGLCLVGNHIDGKWMRSELGPYEELHCLNCDVVLASNAPEEMEQK